MNLRAKKIITTFSQHKIDALLITCPTNITYLTQYLRAEESWLLVCQKGLFFITDSRYYLQVKNNTSGIKVVCLKKSLADETISLVKDLKLKSVGFEERFLTFAQYRVLAKGLSTTVKLIPTRHIVENERQIKSAEEVLNIRKALKFHKQVLNYIGLILKPGLKELDILVKIENYIKTHGYGLPFDIIVASGINSCYPHARVTRREIRKNDIVLLDMGVDYKGYKSDLTRMFFLGRISRLIKDYYNILKGAQEKAIAIIKPGVSVAEVDKEARNYLAEKGLDKYFTHALGHGVGLDIHEIPRVSTRFDTPLKEGMVITIEPGIYLPNKFGIRVEDMVLVTKKGSEVLSDDIN